MTDEEKQALLTKLRDNQNPYSSLLDEDTGIPLSNTPIPLADPSTSTPQEEHPPVTLDPDLEKIAQIESSGGKNKNHEMTKVGLNAGDTAGGSTGMMPIMAQEILRKNPDLAKKYSDLTSASHDDITSAINSNPEMEADLANAHWDRLNKVFGGDTARMAYAWRNGITAAKKASDVQVQEHPYVQKFLNGQPEQVARFSRLKGILGN